MKTIIWKELRENLKWAALALLCLTLAEAFLLYRSSENAGRTYEEYPVCSAEFLLVTSFGCALVGAALGALQILPELRPDQWAALLHRPVRRQTIFFGKVVAGLLLYLPATLLPLLASVVYTALPGHYPAPFVPSMALPALSDVLTGVAFYFAALLVSLARGPWYGRRTVLALSILPLFAYHFTTGWLFLPPLLSAIILLLAAYGAMMGPGNRDFMTLLARCCSLLVILSGIECLLYFVLTGLFWLPGNKFYVRIIGQDLSPQITRDGQVVIFKYDPATSSRSYSDPEGHPLNAEPFTYTDTSTPFLFPALLLTRKKTDEEKFEDEMLHHPRTAANYARLANTDAWEAASTWHFLPGRNYFVGYDKLSRRRIGICDREGFHSADAVPKPFPREVISSQHNRFIPYLYWTPDQLYGVDFSERTLASHLRSTNDKIYTAAALAPDYQTVYIAVALEKEIQILNLSGTPFLSIPYAHDRAIWSYVLIATTHAADRIFLMYRPGPEAQGDESPKPVFVDEYDLHGKQLHSYSVPMPRYLPYNMIWSARVTLGALPLAPAALYGWLVSPKSHRSNYLFVSAASELWAQSRGRHLAILCAICIVLGIVVFLWARHTGFSANEARLWALFVFCFGLPGLIAFRLGARWPTRVPCPSCSHKRPIETQECPACHQAWPSPQSNGTEILAAH